MTRPWLLLLTYIFIVMFSLFSFSQEDRNHYHLKIPKFPSPPQIDGILENSIWKKGAVIENFTQYKPKEGAKPSEKTVAYFGYDKKNLYIAVRCFDSDPKAIRASLTQRDKYYLDDEATIYLDTFNDKKRAFLFQINPCGVQQDAIYTELRGEDKTWDAFFLSSANIDDSGYTIELAIPFKSLRFPDIQTQIWGLQVERKIRRKNEEMHWYPRSRNVNGFLVQSGTLEINGSIEKGRNFDPEVGLNLKYNVTSNLTADITINPDFSQVEADMPQIDVNQRFALYYPEKRPFFLEGKAMFDTPLNLVYTRKIVNPQWGIKLTGKIGKTTLGFLSAYDENPTEIDIPLATEIQERPSNKAFINVFRLKRDIFTESYIGFIITDKEMGYSWNSLMNNYSRVVGIDGHFKFQNYYRFSFQVMGSQSKVSNERTDFIPAMIFSFNRKSRHLNLSADYESIPVDFEAATGFLRRKDIKSFSTEISYTFLPQENFIISISPSFQYKRIYDFNNTLTDEELNFSGSIIGWMQSTITATFSDQLERYGGIDFHKKTFMTNFRSDPFSWLSGNISFSFGDGIYYSETPFLGYKTSSRFEITLFPLTNFQLNYDLKNNKFYKNKGGEKVYSIKIISLRASYHFSRALSLRLITDYNNYDKKLYTSALTHI